MTDPAFAPHGDLAARLLAALPDTDDGSHDRAHLMRVWRLARTIQAEDGGDLEILLAATLLHDAVAVEKSSPDRARASAMAAGYAVGLLRELGWPADRIADVAHAIEAHSFSAGVEPETIEARILQDADRLDAIGHVGIARCFYTAGRMRSGLYDPADPLAAARPLDDRRHALDHLAAKLLPIAARMTTPAGRRIAAERAAAMRAFVDGFAAEVSGG